MKVQPNPMKAWFYSNLWNIGTLAVIVIAGSVYLRTAVVVNAQAIARLEAVVAEYPSEDWFNLKFQTIEEKISDLEDR